MNLKKSLFLAIIFIFSCQDKEDEETSQFVGKWKLIEMGKYLVAGKCDGEIDDEEYRGLKSKGFTLTLEFKNDGSGIETRTGPEAGTEVFTWTELVKPYVLKIAAYRLIWRQMSFHFESTFKKMRIARTRITMLLEMTIRGHVKMQALQILGFLSNVIPRDTEEMD